jgi:hypothetical protein
MRTGKKLLSVAIIAPKAAGDESPQLIAIKQLARETRR